MSFNFANYVRLSIPEGSVKKITRKSDGLVLWIKKYVNQVLSSTEADGKTIYNGGLGYKNGYRIRSGGAEATQDGASCTGLIPVKGGDVVRLSGYNAAAASVSNAINASNGSFTNIGQIVGNSSSGGYGIFATGEPYQSYGRGSIIEERTGVWKWIVPPAASGVAYIRVTGYTYDGSEMIVTVNEEITE